MIRPPAVGTVIAYSVDTQGTIWLRVYDIAGMLICIAPVPAEGALQLADYIDDHYSVEDEDDEIGAVVGHA